MRDYTGLFDYHPTLVGTFSTIGGTAIGAPVDCQSFRDVMAIMTAGAVSGTGDGSADLTIAVKMQEADNIDATGADWTDITDNGIAGGSFDFDNLRINSTSPQMYMEKQYYKRHADSKRYLRCHATLSGTVGVGPKVVVGFLLGRPTDTLYIVDAETQATGNTEGNIILHR